MKTYVIRRPQAWKNKLELEQTAKRSATIGNEEMPDRVRWIRSYVVNESDGSLGTVCIYQAVDTASILDHAARVGMPAENILEVADTVIIREDPKDQASASQSAA